MNGEVNEEERVEEQADQATEAQEAPVGEQADQATEAQETPVGEQPAAQAGKPKKGWKQELKEWVVALVTALVVVFVVRTFLFTVIRVDGLSMYPTLNDNERLFVTVMDVKFFGGASRDDVVICHYPNRGNTYFVKRVVGVPGDKVCRISGVTYVNGEPLDPLGLIYEAPYDYDEYTLGENEYFCVGDNRYDSHDSRDWNDGDPSRDVGPIDKSMIVGKVRCVIWPLSAIRSVE